MSIERGTLKRNKMEVTMKEGERLTVKSEKGRFAAYVVLECIDGQIMNRTDSDRG